MILYFSHVVISLLLRWCFTLKVSSKSVMSFLWCLWWWHDDAIGDAGVTVDVGVITCDSNDVLDGASVTGDAGW